jgi:hypothetical protein
MKRRYPGGCVELSVTPHPARTGWEVVRLNYDADNPRHLAQVEAAIAAFTKARRVCAPEQAGAAAPCGQASA